MNLWSSVLIVNMVSSVSELTQMYLDFVFIAGKGKGTLLVTYTAYSDVFSAFNPSLRSSGQPQRNTGGPTPDSKPVP